MPCYLTGAARSELWGLSMAELSLGDVALARDAHDTARRHFEVALRLAREINQLPIVIKALQELVCVAQAVGDLRAAERLLEECQDAVRVAGSDEEIAWVAEELDRLTTERGRGGSPDPAVPRSD